MFQRRADFSCLTNYPEKRQNAILHLTKAFLLPAIVGIAMAVAASPVSAQSSSPELVLSQSDIIRRWEVGGGFVYWYDACDRPSNESEAFLKRRAVNGFGTYTLVEIDDAGACDTFIGAAVDDRGFYYYNRSAGAIEAVYSDTPFESPTVLATVGERAEYEMSGVAVDDEYLYWIETDSIGEFSPDEVRLYRVSKTDAGDDPEMLLTYGADFAHYALAVSDEWILWTDADGLQGIRKSSCAVECDRTLIHEAHMEEGGIALNSVGEIFWWNVTTSVGPDSHIYYTRCPTGADCQSQSLYTPPDSDSTRIQDLVANRTHLYWVERNVSADVFRLMRRPIVGGSPDIILEDDLAVIPGLGLDGEGIYYVSDSRQQIWRLPLDAEAIQREISFAGWEATQAIQNLENDVPLVAGKETFVRVFPELESGADSAGVEAVLYGERDGTPLPGSPLRPLEGPLSAAEGISLEERRSDPDRSWLFQLPASWTQTGEEAIPLEDTALDLRVEIDPRGFTGDTTPGDNSAEGSFDFAAKAPTCMKLRPVQTPEHYQRAWDASVEGVLEVAESMIPTGGFITFPSSKQLSELEWCWKGPVYGPFCFGPYELNDDDSKLLVKMGTLNYFGTWPDICFQRSARGVFAGIVPAETTWEWAGLARRGGVQSLSKVPRYGKWSWPMSRHTGLATTFAHEVGHNFGRRHVDCGDPDDPDPNFPYATDKLDDGSPNAASTYFGFDPRHRELMHPAGNRDYMSYCGPSWTTDYTWRAIFDGTGPADRFSNLGADSVEPAGAAQDGTYVLVSGLITPSLPAGDLSPIWTYPVDELGESSRQEWDEAITDPWSDQPYHVRVLDGEGEILDDRSVELLDIEDREGTEEQPFHVVFPEPDAGAVQTVQLMQGESVLDSYSTGASTPEVTILAPQGGETVEDEFTLEWTADDADEEPWLNYTIQYSPDNGEHWHGLVTEHPGAGQGTTESLQLDLSRLPGSEGATARLRVLASDGYHTGMATSEAFTVLPRRPDVLITAPEQGQWYEADEAVQLRGSAFDPEDVALGDSAYAWLVGGRELAGERAVVSGLAPDAYTATLRVTDSDGQQGSAETGFHIAPLDAPRVEEITQDGRCDDTGYGDLTLSLSPYAGGDVAYASVARTADHLWVCLQGLQGEGEYAGFQIDVDNSQASSVQASDRGFFVRADGTPVGLAGDGEHFTPVAPEGLAAHIHGDDSSLWSAELRLDAEVFGGWNRRVALAFGHYLDGEQATWPYATALENPQTWAQTTLAEAESLSLTAVSPQSTTVGSSIALTLTGSGFQEETVALWNGAELATQYVDEGTLQATLEGEATGASGSQEVQVAPVSEGEVIVEAASSPRPFLVYHGEPEITGLTPDTAPMEGDGLTLSVAGSGFAQGATVLWQGEPRPTTYVDGSRLEAEIAAQDLAAGRPVAVTVSNPDPSLAVSEPATFTVQEDDDNGGGDGDGDGDSNGDGDGEENEFRLYVPNVQRE